MKCPNCGRESSTVIDECSGCGLILAKWRAGAVRPFAKAPPAQEPPRAAAGKRLERWAWGAVALLASAMLWHLYGPERDKPSRPDASSTASGSSAAPAALDESSFDAFFSGPGTGLVMFYSNSCGICRAALPAMDRLAEEAGGRYRVGLADAEAHPGLSGRYGVRGVPFFVFFKDGREAYRAPGAPGYDTDSIYSGIREILLSLVQGGTPPRYAESDE